jgi:hypothetical protein
MLKIDKIRFHDCDKLSNRYYVYVSSIYYIVKRPSTEKPLTSINIIQNCKNEEDIFNIGGKLPPKGGKVTLQEYFEEKGLA